MYSIVIHQIWIFCRTKSVQEAIADIVIGKFLCNDIDCLISWSKYQDIHVSLCFFNNAVYSVLQSCCLSSSWRAIDKFYICRKISLHVEVICIIKLKEPATQRIDNVRRILCRQPEQVGIFTKVYQLLIILNLDIDIQIIHAYNISFEFLTNLILIDRKHQLASILYPIGHDHRRCRKMKYRILFL